MSQNSSKAYCNASKRYADGRFKPDHVGQTVESGFILTQTASQAARSAPHLRRSDPRAPPTYPFLAYATVKDRSEVAHSPARTGLTNDLL